MNIDLFFSGAPSDNEWFPKNDDLNYCGKFFSYTESPYSIDYEVEVIPEKGYSYYTYMRHRGVSGFDRESSYFAMTIKITDGYCADIIGLYHLLDVTYRNWIVGTITSQTNNGEKYLTRSLMSAEETRKEAEKRIMSGLQLMINRLHVFDKTFANSRQKQTIGIVSISSFKNEQLMQELKQTHKLHLISDNDMSVVTSNSIQEKIKEYEDKLKAKDIEITSAKNAQRNAETAKNKVEKEFKDYKDELSKDPSERRWQTISKDVSEIKAMIVGRQKGVLIGEAHRNQSSEDTNNNSELFHDIKDVKKMLPWILWVITFIALIVCIFRKSQPDSIDVSAYREQIQQYENENRTLNAEVNRLRSENVDLVNSFKQTTSTSNTIKKEEPKPSYIDVEGISDSKVKIGNHRVAVKSSGGTKTFPEIDWIIATGDSIASKNGNILKCNAKGNITLSATYNGKKMTRSFTITE